MIKELKYLGLDKSEIEIYLAMLKLGKASASELAQKSKVKRTSVYDILNRLNDHGLTSSITEEGTQYYLPKNPSTLLDIIQDHLDTFDKQLPSLLWLSSNPKIKTKVEYFNTTNSLELIYEDTLKLKNDHHYCFVPTRGEKNIQNYLSKYIKRRVANKIYKDEIYDNSSNRIVTETENKAALRNLVDLPKEYHLPAEVYIYAKNKVAFISYEDLTGVKIIDKQIHNTFKSIFSLSWQQLTNKNAPD